MSSNATLSMESGQNDAQEKYRKQMLSWKFRFYLIAKMPIAYVAGLQLTALTTQEAKATMPFRWLSQNPFRSIYFATQSMAAELSTGAIALLAVKDAKPSVAMLITSMRSEYSKKATAKVTFHCTNGEAIFDAVNKSLATGKGQKVEVETVGTMADGTEVSRFWFTWSFKARSK